MSGLRNLQKNFRAALLGHESVGLSDVMPAARLNVYRNTVQRSLVDALAASFPVIHRVVGADFFAGFARKFIAAHPPERPQLSTYGEKFADFISLAKVGRQLPYLADVARLEWARNESYFAADVAPLDPQQLAVDAEQLEDMTVRLHPAARCVASRFPIFTIWEVNQPDIGDVPVVDMNVPQAVMISRPTHHVVTRAVPLADAAFIIAIMEGETFGGAVDTALLNDPAFDLQQALALHFQYGTFWEISP
jgi:hypothetical protein